MHFKLVEGFSTRWQQEYPRFTFREYIGDIEEVPVFFIHNNESSYVMVIDLTRVGKLVRYLPAENNVSGMLIKVTEIDEVEANRIIENQPKFLEGNDGNIRTRDEAIRDLLLKVRIYVGIKYEFEIEAEDAVQKISVQ